MIRYSPWKRPRFDPAASYVVRGPGLLLGGRRLERGATVAAPLDVSVQRLRQLYEQRKVVHSSEVRRERRRVVRRGKTGYYDVLEGSRRVNPRALRREPAERLAASA